MPKRDDPMGCDLKEPRTRNEEKEQKAMQAGAELSEGLGPLLRNFGDKGAPEVQPSRKG
jgi:hypothetical protein